MTYVATNFDSKNRHAWVSLKLVLLQESGMSISRSSTKDHGAPTKMGAGPRGERVVVRRQERLQALRGLENARQMSAVSDLADRVWCPHCEIIFLPIPWIGVSYSYMFLVAL